LGGACSSHRKDERCKKVLVRKHEGKRPLGRHRHNLEDNIKMDIGEIRWEDMDWIH
jgi:hypothetical protein